MPDRHYPPGPSTSAAIRGLRDMGGGNDLSGVPIFLAAVARRYGGMSHWTILGRHFFLLDDPAGIEEVLVAKTHDYRKGRGIQRLKGLLGDGLICGAVALTPSPDAAAGVSQGAHRRLWAPDGRGDFRPDRRRGSWAAARCAIPPSAVTLRPRSAVNVRLQIRAQVAR